MVRDPCREGKRIVGFSFCCGQKIAIRQTVVVHESRRTSISESMPAITTIVWRRSVSLTNVAIVAVWFLLRQLERTPFRNSVQIRFSGTVYMKYDLVRISWDTRQFTSVITSICKLLRMLRLAHISQSRRHIIKLWNEQTNSPMSFIEGLVRSNLRGASNGQKYRYQSLPSTASQAPRRNTDNSFARLVIRNRDQREAIVY